MGKLKIKGYELRDVAVIQAPVSFACHRGDVNPFIEVCNREVYPIFVAPMASVTDQNNYKTWIENKVTPVIPRSVQKSELNPNGLTFEERMELAKDTFVSISLNEAKIDFIKWGKDHFVVAKDNPEEIWLDSLDINYYICIDIAHGTLSEMYNCAKILKRFKNVVLMTGNVATPACYSFYADAGIDYVRVGIGGGARCTSSANVSIHYPMATLLDNLNEERKAYAHSHNGKAPTKIIADGGINWFDDIQKALALGADAVMCGKIFAECEEACEETYYTGVKDGIFDLRNQWDVKREAEAYYEHSQYEVKKCRDYYGMSTKRAQCITGGSGDRTSEGIDKPVEVKYPVAKWIDNMQSYLRSCMTYTNSHTIKELRENAQVIILGGSGDAAYRK